MDHATGDFRLQQDPCQPGITNPCVDAGSSFSMNLNLHEVSTRTDGVPDGGMADMGYTWVIICRRCGKRMRTRSSLRIPSHADRYRAMNTLLRAIKGIRANNPRPNQELECG